MVGGMDRCLGLASIAVGLLATVVLGIAVSADYWALRPRTFIIIIIIITIEVFNVPSIP